MMEDVLYNPVYNALNSTDAPFALGTDKVKYFDENISPFAGIQDRYQQGFEDLAGALPAGRKILFATPNQMAEPASWKFMVEIKGLQFVFPEHRKPGKFSIKPTPLHPGNVEEMLQLAALTKPGPFNVRTIEFGYYHGIFENGQLVAMTGQRLHVENYTEISAVCTHPGFLGKGYAAALILHQLDLIHSHGQKAFLHVREDNSRAIALYERLGFEVKRRMNFYFMRKRGEER